MRGETGVTGLATKAELLSKLAGSTWVGSSSGINENVGCAAAFTHAGARSVPG
ncbi:MAG: hypothetical protein U0793_34125 [Gemmataceae bacterium]